MRIDQGTLNVVRFSGSYLVNYFAFMSQEFIQEPLMESVSKTHGTVGQHAGYDGFTILWFINAVACLFCGVFVEKLTAKWSMVLGVIIYIFYQASFLHINPISLYSMSVLMGIGSSLLGVAQGKALAENSTSETVDRNTSIMWTIFKTALIFGGIFLTIMYRNQTLTESIDNGDYAIMCYAFIGINIVGAVNLALLPQPVYRVEKKQQTTCQVLGATFKLMCTKKMFFMIFIFFYLGIARAFWVSLYPACIKFTTRLGGNTTQWLAISCLATGIGQVLASIVLSLLGTRAKVIGREYIYMLGTIIHIIVYVMICLFFPSDAHKETTNKVSVFEPNKYVAIVSSGFLGFGDAILQIEMQTFIVEGWPMESSHAFAIFKCFGGLATGLVFLAAKWFSIPTNMIFNAVLAIVSTIAAFIVQRKYFTDFKKDNLAGVEIRIDDDGSTIKQKK